jgi:hypothetical protein
MLVNYTMVLDGPSVSVECPTQQGVKSNVEVTPESSVLWLELPPASSSSSPSGSPPVAGMPYGGAGGMSG